AAFDRASASISSVMSRPYTLPAGPTRRALSSASMPPPLPRSSTTSPGLSSASAVGLPQPSDARTARSGSAAVAASSYRSREIGSTDSDSVDPFDPQHSGPQHDPSSP